MVFSPLNVMVMWVIPNSELNILTISSIGIYSSGSFSDFSRGSTSEPSCAMFVV